MGQGGFAGGLESRMLENGTAGFGVGFEHPDPVVLIDAQIEAQLAQRMIVPALDSLGQLDGGFLGRIQHAVCLVSSVYSG
ncbi:hypothetical protein D3C76_1769530 [compost metagenome]